jgi:hypothetical protein
MADRLELWRWRYTDEFGKRRVTRWHMSEDTVKQFADAYKDAEKIEGTLEIRKPAPSTGDFMRSASAAAAG